MKCIFTALLLGATSLVCFAELPAEFEANIAKIQAIGNEGSGNEDARSAWQAVSKANGDAIVPILVAMEESGPISKNMLRSAVEVIVERELKAGNDLPVASLGKFLLDTRESPQARRMAFDLVKQANGTAASRLIPGFINDPSVDLRREAVKNLMLHAKGLLDKQQNNDAAILVYRQALNSARDVEQVQEITQALRDLEQEVNLPDHFGFLMDWKLIAPFDNTDRAGFEKGFPPENEINLDATYEGKAGRKVSWIDHTSEDEYGKIDFNKAFEQEKEVVGYAYTEFEAAQAGPVELRLGGKNAWKVWVNGEFVFGRDEYHRGKRIDQYLMPVQLKEGKNTILVKCCQSKEDERWTVEWEFQLRVCDPTGTAILARNRGKGPLLKK